MNMHTVTVAIYDNTPRKHYYYVCPTCLRPTAGMVMLEKGHEPTEEELDAAGHGIFDLIGHEMMACYCGRELTWFQLMCMELVR